MRRAWIVAAVLVVGVLGLAYLFRTSGYEVVLQHRRGAPTTLTTHFALGAASPSPRQDFEAATPRNLVLLIGDGMGFGQVHGARAALRGMNGRLEMERLPVVGWVTTHSADRLITDSGAAATALATGFKTDLGQLATTPDGEPVRTLMEAARDGGKAVGLLTDSYLWDATPAAFAVHLESRRDYAAVASQMAASGFELLLGEATGGPRDEPDGSFLTAFRNHGYDVVRDGAGLAASADTTPTVGLFAPGGVSNAEQETRLADLTAYAIERLARRADGFALLVESEEPDSASHRADFERLVRGVAALDDAVRVAVDFARRDRHTLVVVTADHETGGLILLRGSEDQPLRVRWATSGHTGDPVPLFAYGPGAEQLAGVRDNTELPRILARLMGLTLALP